MTDSQNGTRENEANGHSEEKGVPKSGETQSITEDPELHSKINKQIEYYFGDYNLPRDKFLSAEVGYCISYNKNNDAGLLHISILLR